MLTHLSLFSGMEGFALGLRLAGLDFCTVGYCEIDGYCQEIIKARIKDGYLDDAPIWPDIRTLPCGEYQGLVDIVTGGFPCQPHSDAGKRRGDADERNLWPETLGIIRDVGPRWVLLENVPGILVYGYGGTVVGQLSEIGYDCIWDCIPAAFVGAPHLRRRWWVLAHSQQGGSVSSKWTIRNGSLEKEKGQFHSRVKQLRSGNEARSISWWLSEPNVSRVDDGVPARVDRIATLGNGIVPAVVSKFLSEEAP